MATAELLHLTLTPNNPGMAQDSHMKLSPHAPEFHPGSTYEGTTMHLCIFNDGVPSLVLASEHDVTVLLHGIADEAIDESFPPTAEEAAELEAVEEFVQMMASLDYMEEKEERARISFNHVQKRWESRRAQGLVGRPHKAKHTVDPAAHGLPTSKAGANSTALVGYEQHERRMLLKHQKLHQKDIEVRGKHMGATSSRRLPSNKKPKQSLPIHQPRK